MSPGDQGYAKLAIFTAKVSSLREFTSFEPFCVKIIWGVWPPEVSRKKSQSLGLPDEWCVAVNTVLVLLHSLWCYFFTDRNNSVKAILTAEHTNQTGTNQQDIATQANSNRTM